MKLGEAVSKPWVQRLNRNRFIICIMLCAVIKHLLTVNIPIYVIGNSPQDDGLMVKLADNLLNGKWLGAYNNNTLVKGAFFPAVLALFNFLGVSYIEGITWLYTLACIFFIYSINPLFKTNKSLFIIYVFLLFNPSSFSTEILQRVYRNGVTLFQVLLVFGAMIGIYLRRGQPRKSLIKWLLIAGIALASMWHTREDGIWILPFVFVVIAILIFSTLITNKKEGKRYQWKKCLIYLLPLVLLIGSNHAISFINYQVYGIYSYNEINDSNFGKAIKAIYSVQNDKEINYVSVTRDKLHKLYEVSPSLNSIKAELESSMSNWADTDRTPGDNEVEDGWFFWVLRDAANQAGLYSSAETANAFYAKIALEIQEATDSGLLESQSTMPSALMSPWRTGYTAKLINTVGEIISFVTGFMDNNTSNIASITVDDGSDILLFESITNNYAIYPTQSANVEGWYIYLGGGEVSFVIEDSDGNIIRELENLASPDVSTALKEQGITNADNCRFNAYFDIDSNENLFFAVYDSEGNLVDKLDLETAKSNTNENHIYHFDKNTFSGNIRQEIAAKYINRANLVSKVYQATGKVVAVVAMLCYFYLIFMAVKNRLIGQFGSITLVLTGIMCSLFVLFLGVAYNHIASCFSITNLYLSGSYPLILAFEWVSICTVAESIMPKLKSLKTTS